MSASFSFSNNASGDLAIETNTHDISVSTSPLSSLRSTPDLGVIDPSILDSSWPGNHGPHCIDGACAVPDSVICDNSFHARIASEGFIDDSAIPQLGTPRIHNHRIGQECFDATADRIPPIISIGRVDDGSTGLEIISTDELQYSPIANGVQKVGFAENLPCTLFNKGPITRARARATRSKVAQKAPKRQHQVLKGQGLGQDQDTPHSPHKQMSSGVRESAGQYSTRRITRSQAKKK